MTGNGHQRYRDGVLVPAPSWLENQEPPPSCISGCFLDPQPVLVFPPERSRGRRAKPTKA